MENVSFDFTSIQPKQKQALKLSLSTPVLFYGGAKGGGKSWLVRCREIARRLKYPNTQGLIVRRTYPELRANHIVKMFQEYPILQEWYNKSEKTIYFPNGSTTEFSYLKNTDDVYTYQGREYQDISVDEITQHEEEVFKTLRSSLRTSDGGIKPSVFLTGNPGGIGHAWVKRIFVDKKFREKENPADFAFIQAFVSDNTALMQADPEYIKRLEDLPEHLRKAYLEGDWNIFAGQAFSELQRSVHIIQPFELPPTTKYFASYDHGYNHPFSFIVFAVVPEGTIYVTKHFTGRLIPTSKIADGIRQYASPMPIYAGHDVFYPGRGGGKSVSDEFEEFGISGKTGYPIYRAKVDRKQGVSTVHRYLNPKNYPDNKPRVFFFSNCLDVYDTVASMQIDEHDPEDVLKMDAVDGEGGDDAYDSFRYGLMSWFTPPENTKNKPDQFAGQTILDSLLEDDL